MIGQYYRSKQVADDIVIISTVILLLFKWVWFLDRFCYFSPVQSLRSLTTFKINIKREIYLTKRELKVYKWINNGYDDDDEVDVNDKYYRYFIL